MVIFDGDFEGAWTTVGTHAWDGTSGIINETPDSWVLPWGGGAGQDMGRLPLDGQEPYAGNYSLAFNAWNTGYLTIAQDMASSMTNGKLYKLDMWYKPLEEWGNAPAGRTNNAPNVGFSDSNGQSPPDMYTSYDPDKTEWTNLVWYFTFNSTYNWFHITCGKKTTAFDNISIKEVEEGHDLVSYWALDETIEASGTGASFVYDKVDESLGSDEAENNTAATNSSRTEADATGGWNATGMSGGTYESVSTEPQDGSYHLRVLNSTGGSHGFRDTNVTLTNGAYKLMFDYKIISGANLKVRVKDNGDTLIVSFTNLSSTSWSNDNIIYFQSTESGTSAAIYFVTHSGNGEFYVDNIRLYPVNGNVGALI